MAQPDQISLHQDVMLTDVLVGYTNLEYVTDSIFPVVPVNRQSNLIAALDQSAWFRDEALIRAPGTASARAGFTVNKNARYFCDRYSLGKEISDEERANADQPFDLDPLAARFVADKIQMRREIQWVADFAQTGVWGFDKVGGTDFKQWNDYANSAPMVDIVNYRNLPQSTVGATPNKALMGQDVFNVLINHPDFIERLKYTQVPEINAAMVSRLFNLPDLVIGGALYTTSPEGTPEASVTYARIHGKYVWLGYVPDGPALNQPAAGYTFVWQRVPSANQYVKRLRVEEREIDVIEGNSYFDSKLITKNSAAFLTTVVA